MFLRCDASRELGWGEDGEGWLSFGDGWNDVEMLQWSQASEAPSNAKHEGARAAAKSISALDNDGGFVAARLVAELRGSGGVLSATASSL